MSENPELAAWLVGNPQAGPCYSGGIWHPTQEGQMSIGLRCAGAAPGL
jgi:hypothetical protein